VLEVDGGERSGSGTILRLSVAYSAILQEDLHIFNIREKRSSPGLRPQHREAVLTAARICDAQVEGAHVGSKELWFRPGRSRGGHFDAEIGTAGSIPMLLLTVIPMCLHSERDVDIRVSKGGTDVSNAPTINYLKYVLLPSVGKMGVSAGLEVDAYGYYPVGLGAARVSVEPCKALKPFCLLEQGKVQRIRGASVCTFLRERKVAERQAEAAKKHLMRLGHKTDIQILYDTSNPSQRGSSLVLWSETSSGAVLGSDAIGELRKTSEKVGLEAAEKLVAEIAGKASVDVHLADMLVPYIALAKEESAYTVRAVTEHIETNVWLTNKLLGTDIKIEESGNLHVVRKAW